MSKLVNSIREAVQLAGLKDGMTVSFHHHLRNGDFVLNMVMDTIAQLGIRDLNVNASSVFDAHAPLLEHMQNGVVTNLSADYIAATVGRAISRGILPNPVQFRTHGGRPSDISLGRTPIDVAFIAAPTADPMGNCSGKYGKSACGSLGYAFADAMYAKKVIVITDNLVPYPMQDCSISEDYVDYLLWLLQLLEQHKFLHLLLLLLPLSFEVVLFQIFDQNLSLQALLDHIFLLLRISPLLLPVDLFLFYQKTQTFLNNHNIFLLLFFVPNRINTGLHEFIKPSLRL